MTGVDFYILNESKDLDDSLLKKWVGALQRSRLHDFLPVAGGYIGEIHVIGRGGKLADNMPGGVMSDVAQKDYLGEHHIEGVPRFVVSMPACKSDNVVPSTVLDHEVKELDQDPGAAECIELEDGTLLAKEECDPVEGDSGTYYVDGVALENFVLPFAYFQGIGSKYDFRGVLKKPFGEDLAPGGYQLLKKPGHQWSQITGELARASKAAPAPWKWSRRGKRVGRGVKL